MIKKLLAGLVLGLSALGASAQSHVFPATDTNNTFTGTNTFNNTTIFGGAISGQTLYGTADPTLSCSPSSVYAGKYFLRTDNGKLFHCDGAISTWVAVAGTGTGTCNIATTGAIGCVKPDGTTITVDLDGTIHAVTSSIPWSALTDPTGNLSLSMAARSTIFTWGNATGSGDMFTYQDTASNTGTGTLVHVKTAAGSLMTPFCADANGVGWCVMPDGSLKGIGSTQHGITIPGNSSPLSGVANSAVVDADTSGNLFANEGNTGRSHVCTHDNGQCATGTGSVTDGAGTSTVPQVAISTTTPHQIAYTQTLPNGIKAVTQSVNDNSTNVATTAYVDAEAGVSAITPGTGITCTPNTAGICKGNVTVNGAAFGNPPGTVAPFIGNSWMLVNGYSTLVPISAASSSGTVTFQGPNNYAPGQSVVAFNFTSPWNTCLPQAAYTISAATPFSYTISGTTCGTIGSTSSGLGHFNMITTGTINCGSAGSLATNVCRLPTGNNFTTADTITINPGSSPVCMEGRNYKVINATSSYFDIDTTNWGNCGNTTGTGAIYWSGKTNWPDQACKQKWFSNVTCINYALSDGNSVYTGTLSNMVTNYTASLHPVIANAVTTAGTNPVPVYVYTNDSQGVATDEANFLTLASLLHAEGSNVQVIVHTIPPAPCTDPNSIFSTHQAQDWSVESTWMYSMIGQAKAPATGQYFDKVISLSGVINPGMCNFISGVDTVHLNNAGTLAAAQIDNGDAGLTGVGLKQDSGWIGATNYWTGINYWYAPSLNTGAIMSALWSSWSPVAFNFGIGDPNVTNNYSWWFGNHDGYATVPSSGCFAGQSNNSTTTIPDTFLCRNTTGEWDVNNNGTPGTGNTGIKLTYLRMTSTTAPTGACSTVGLWEWAQDGTSAWCNGTTWQAVAASSSVNVNGLSVSNPNFNAASPLPDASFIANTFKVSGSNVINETPYGTNAAKGVLQCDGTTTTCASGVISSTGGSVTVSTFSCADTSGSGTAQSCTASPTLSSLVANQTCMVYTTTTPNSGTGLTVNASSLGAKSVAIPGSSGWTTTLTAGIIPSGKPIQMCYDGTNWDVIQTGTVSGTSSGGGGAWTNITGSTQITASGCTQSDTTGGYCAVTGSTTTAVTLSALPGTYNSLHVIIYGGSTAGTSVNVNMAFNSGGTYATNGVYQFGASASGVNGNSNLTSCAMGTLGSAFGSATNIDIPGYADTSFSHVATAQLVTVNATTSTNASSGAANYSCGWSSTAAVTSITFTIASNDYAPGTKFLIYGVGSGSSGGGGSYPTPVTLTASASAELDFTTCFSSSYRDYEIRFDSLVITNSGTNAFVQLSDNGGSTYDSATSSYANGFYQIGVLTNTAFTSTQFSGQAGFFLGGYSGSGAGAVSGKLLLTDIRSGGSFTGVAQTVTPGGSSIFNAAGTQYHGAITNPNAFRVIAPGSNLTSGSVTCQPLPK